MRSFLSGTFLSLMFLSTAPSSYACDLCSIYQAQSAEGRQSGTFRMGVSEQFTEFNKIQDGGKFVENEGHQHLESSVTQLYSAYDLTSKIGVQINLPYINRKFVRVEGGERQSGTEAGIGDLNLIGKYLAFHTQSGESSTGFEVFGGIKLPTGDSRRLKEEQEEIHTKHGDEHHEELIPSAIHGHDLALGSGSIDFPVGASFSHQRGRFKLQSSIQYVFRNHGDHSYEYADDLNYSVAPGYYLSLGHSYTVAALLNLSGEYKGKDTGPDGERAGDTAVRALYIGPALALTSGDNLSGEIGWDMPIDINNSERQAVPSYRVRLGVSFRF